MQAANMKMSPTTNNIVTINGNFDKANHFDTQEETVRHLLSKKHVTIKQKMIKKLKREDHILHFKQELCDLRTKLKTFIATKQQNYQKNCGSGCQFTCPICLQMFLTPCPTSCGHMFCYRCIDESIIRRSSCPSCRSNIRNEQFVESKPFSKMSDFFWSTSKEKQSYNDKRLKNQEWIKGRKINIEDVKIEDFIDARDTEFIWCKAKIMNIFKNNGKTQFLVHFLGWNQIYDQIIISSSQRLAPFKFFSQRNDIPKYRVNAEENNMRSRIDYPVSEDESDSNNLIFAFENNRQNVRRNHFQPARRPIIQQIIARRRNLVPDFPLFNGVSNYFINLRSHPDQSSSSNDVAEGNNVFHQQTLSEGENEEQEVHIELDQQEYDGIDEDEELDIEISNSNMNDSYNIQDSNADQLDQQRDSNQSPLIDSFDNRSQSQNSHISGDERLGESQIIQAEQQSRNSEPNQSEERQIQEGFQLDQFSQYSSENVERSE